MDSQDFGENSRGMDVECLEEDEEVVKMQRGESSGEGKKRKVVDILYDTLDDGNSDAENDGKLLDPDPEEDQKMFCFPATVYIRNFKGHKTGPSIGKVFVNCETSAEVMSTVWNYCESYVRREAVFEPVVGGDANKYTVHWHENETPDQGDMDKFITFQSKASKRTYKPTQLLDKPEKIQKFLKKDVNVFVHIYSESVTSANMYDILRTQLLKPEERDRAGAASNQTIRNLSDELKAIYETSYRSSEINWSVWASFLLTKDPFEREELKMRGPPHHLIHLFQTVPSSSQKVLDNTRKDICIAQNVNSGFKEQLKNIQADLDKLMVCANSIQLRLSALCTMQTTNESLLTDVSGSIAAAEDSFGRELAEDVVDAVDTDHL